MNARVVEIGVTGLFGLYDHVVKLKDEHVTIIHGPNGVGKTVFLELVSAFVAGRFNEVVKIPFERFYLRLADDTLFALSPPSVGGVLHEPPRVPSSADLHCLFIATNRLFCVDDEAPLNTTNSTARIDTFSKNLAERLEEARAEYGQKGSQLDQSFPDRLIDASDDEPELSGLEDLFAEINTQRQRYESVSLLDVSTDAERFDIGRLKERLSPIKLMALSLNAKDTKANQDVLEPLARKIETFLTLMNRKLQNKTLRAVRHQGVLVQDVYGKTFPLTSLSTGEQHLFVLLYDLLFSVQPNQLVLIDEPEQGMHISWQRDFVDDLLDIIKLSPLSFDVILATHSPSIINGHRDLMVPFKRDLAA